MFTASDFRRGDTWQMIDGASTIGGDEMDCAVVEILEDGLDSDGDVYTVAREWQGCDCSEDCGCSGDEYAYFKPTQFAYRIQPPDPSRPTAPATPATPDSITIEQILNYTS